jgi:hypothetical protein
MAGLELCFGQPGRFIMILDAEDPGRGRSHPIEIVAACRQEALGRSEGRASEAETRRQTRSTASLVDRRGVGLMADGRSPPDSFEVVLATDEAADHTMDACGVRHIYIYPRAGSARI